MTDQTSTVRIATEADIPQIFELCRLLHEENGVASMSLERVGEMIRNGVDRNRGVIGVIGPSGALEGCISLVIDALWYTDDPHVSELFNFVHPDHRKSGHAKALIEFAKSTVDALGVPMFIGVVSNDRTEAKIRLYERQLGKPAGAFFIHGQYGAAADVR